MCCNVENVVHCMIHFIVLGKQHCPQCTYLYLYVCVGVNCRLISSSSFLLVNKFSIYVRCVCSCPTLYNIHFAATNLVSLEYSFTFSEEQKTLWYRTLPFPANKRTSYLFTFLVFCGGYDSGGYTNIKH